MSDLGLLFRKARTEKGISLDELQESTKIRKRYLEAIEEGNYKILPGNFYARAFIKSYAEAVGLDAEEVLRLYRNEIPSVTNESTEPPVIKRKSKGLTNTEKLSRIAILTLLIAFPLLIVGIIYYFFVVSPNDDGNQLDAAPITDQVRKPDNNNETPSPQDNEAPDEEPDQPVNISEVTFSHAENGIDFYQIVDSNAKLQIELSVTGDKCWLQLRSNGPSGTLISETTLIAGDVETWEIDESSYLWIGRANAVEIKVNGVEINAGDTSNPKKFQFDLITNTQLPNVNS